MIVFLSHWKWPQSSPPTWIPSLIKNYTRNQLADSKLNKCRGGNRQTYLHMQRRISYLKTEDCLEIGYEGLALKDCCVVTFTQSYRDCSVCLALVKLHE